MNHAANPLDPDRFLRFQGPGSQEWWYFDAISDDARDVIVLVWYAGLPFDPKYGVAAIRHLKNPKTAPNPDPLDHSAIGFQWHRDGKLMAYALNVFPARAFAHQAEPFVLDIAGNRLERDADGYRLTVETPSVDTRTPIRVEMRFRPASQTEPFENDLGSSGSAHVWILAAADCHVEGTIAVGTNSVSFQGRGYHDHNAGESEISRAMRHWEWGRVHRGAETDVFYMATPHEGPPQSLWITLCDGKPHDARRHLEIEESEPIRNIFGVRSSRALTLKKGAGRLTRRLGPCLDDGPFYRRWLTDFDGVAGISEKLDCRNLNRRLFNWMIPYRLKRPLG